MCEKRERLLLLALLTFFQILLFTFLLVRFLLLYLFLFVFCHSILHCY